MRMHRPTSRGFTILELMITIALAGVLAAVAIPNMRDFVRNGRLTGAANDLLRSMQVARSEAIKRQRIVAVCASDAPHDEDPTCSNGAFSGWVVFQDTNNNWDRDEDEDVIDRQVVSDGVTAVSNNNGVVSYAPTGFSNSTAGQTPTSRVVFCDVRGNTQVGPNSTARSLIVEPAGRTRVTRDVAEITSALTTIGDVCP